jgi:hypothetical protein
MLPAPRFGIRFAWYRAEPEETMRYDRKIRLRGRPWYQAARRVALGYELDPAENRGFILFIPAYLVVEDAPNQLPPEAKMSSPLKTTDVRHLPDASRKA